MKYYIQYLIAEGKDRLGTDGRQILDGRLSLENMENEALRSASKKIFKPYGFKIVKANNFRESGFTIKTHIFKTY